jgi:adenosylmethionine-8-amino-7-oxononanoate aminotransferase
LEQHGHEVAAVIVEPLCQGAAGMRIYSPAYLRQLRALCDQHGALLIADEIAMGMGRTGRMFAFEHAGIDPDIACLGKGLTAGYLPMSAAIVKQSIYETFTDSPEDHTFYHGHTFAGNPLAAAAARECLEIYRDENIVERAAQMAETLRDAMQVFQELPGTKNVRCLGMVAALELHDAECCQRVRKTLLGKGVLLRPLGNVLYLMLPLITPEGVLRQTVCQLEQAIRTTE